MGGIRRTKRALRAAVALSAGLSFFGYPSVHAGGGEPSRIPLPSRSPGVTTSRIDASAAQQAAPLQVIHHNIAGEASNNGNVIANKGIKDGIDAYGKPWAISVNEGCHTQGVDLATWLNNKGWSRTYSRKFVQVPNVPTCGDYGAVTWATADYTASRDDSSFGPYPASMQLAPPAEQRGYTCLYGGGSQRKFVACTTHLKSQFLGGPDLRHDQFRHYYGTVVTGIRGSGSKVNFSGDWYLTPSELQVVGGGFTYATNKEADRCPSPLNRFTVLSPDRKVDHVMAGSSQSCPRQAEVYWSGFSDHRVVVSFITAI